MKYTYLLALLLFHIPTHPHANTAHWQNHVYLSRIFADGCYCALNQHSYALFGGINKVLFMHIMDSDAAENCLLSHLPADAGNVTHLEYSKRDTQEKNFFFAGTDKGLFVFTDNDGEGCTSPFTTGIWKHVPTIAGTVIDLACMGNALYVLTSHTTNTDVFKTVLYVIPFAPLEQEKPVAKNTITSLFAPDNVHVIATSGSDIFANVTYFTAIALIATSSDNILDGDSPEKREQLVLATSNGLFISDACQETKEEYVLAGIADARTQIDAQWKRVPNMDYAFTCIGIHDTPVQHDVFPFHYTSTKKEINSYAHHVYGSYDPNIGPSKPLITFDASFDKLRTSGINIPGKVGYAWKNDERSFYITTLFENGVRKNKLFIMTQDDISSSFDPSSAILRQAQDERGEGKQNACIFYWVKNIGITDIIMAGTDQGVIALT